MMVPSVPAPLWSLQFSRSLWHESMPPRPVEDLSASKITMDREILEELHRADCAGHWALTRHLCELVLAECPSHGPTLLRYAACLTTFSLYDEAAAVLNRADAAVPKKRRHLVLTQRGHLRKAMGAYAEAESLFLAAHELDPNDATYLIYAFSAASARGDVSRAEELIRRALECQKGCFDEAYFNLGGCLLRKKQYHEARQCYEQALEIDPDYEIAKVRLADLDALRERQRDPSGAASTDSNPQ